jgi:hypothetical protein
MKKAEVLSGSAGADLQSVPPGIPIIYTEWYYFKRIVPQRVFIRNERK